MPSAIDCASEGESVVLRLPAGGGARHRFEEALSGSGDAAAAFLVGFAKAAGGGARAGDALEFVLPSRG